MSTNNLKLYDFRVLILSFLLFGTILANSLSVVNAGTTTITSIPISSAEITNPDRGLYRWRKQEIESRATPSLDDYNRYDWAQIETSDGVFDFSAIDADYNSARSAGRHFSFRLRAMLGYNNGEVYVPAYLAQEPYGWWDDYNNDGSPDTFVPNWNDAVFLSKLDRFVKAVGARYNSSKYISWIDIGMYGQYGEWALSECSSAGASNCIDYHASSYDKAAQSSLNAIINSHVAAFPNQQLVMAGAPYSAYDSLLYAFNQPTTYPIGFRVDCLGDSTYFNQWTNRPTAWNNIKDRWQVAPVVGEYCSSGITFSAAQTQITSYHFSAVGNGNVSGYSSMTSANKDQFLLNGKLAGYRFEIGSVELPNDIKTGQTISAKLNWRNVGNAPVYKGWTTQLRLKNSAGVVVYTKTSSVNLKSVSLINSTYTAITDSLVIPTGLPAGNYTLNVLISDPDATRSPLKLAISGIQSDGSYNLTTFAIATATVTPTPTPTPVPTPTPTPTPVPVENPDDSDNTDGDNDIDGEGPTVDSSEDKPTTPIGGDGDSSDTNGGEDNVDNEDGNVDTDANNEGEKESKEGVLDVLTDNDGQLKIGNITLTKLELIFVLLIAGTVVASVVLTSIFLARRRQKK